MAGPDDPIKENPPQGVTYKSLTTGQVDDLVKKTVAGRPLTANDLQGWGPEAVRLFSTSYYKETRDDNKNGVNLVRDIAEGRIPPDKVEEETKKRIKSGRVQESILNAGLRQGSPIADQGKAIAAIAADLDVVGANVSKLSQDRTAAANAPPILTLVAAQNFPPAPAGGLAPDKSIGDFKYASVTPADAAKVAQDLLAGKRDQVAAAIKTWGGNSLGAVLNEYRSRLWPEDLNKAKQAMAAMGTQDYGDRLKAIQSPELKALVEKENAALTAGKSRAEVNYDFDALQKGIFGKGIEVYSAAMSVYQDREGKFLQQKQQQKGPATATPDNPGGPAVKKPDRPPGFDEAAAATSTRWDIVQTAQKFAREDTTKWPNVKGWDDLNMEAMRIAYHRQMDEDVKQATDVAQLLQGGGDPRKIDDIQNPRMKRIVDSDMKEGKSMDDIVKDLKNERDARGHFVDQKIDMSYTSQEAQLEAAQKRFISSRP